MAIFQEKDVRLTSLARLVDSINWHLSRKWRVSAFIDQHNSPEDAIYTITFERKIRKAKHARRSADAKPRK